MNKINLISGGSKVLCQTGTIVFEDVGGSRELSLSAYHLSNGRIFLTGAITQQTAVDFASKMNYLADEQKPVSIFIDTPGGEINAGLAIYDIIQSYKYPIDIYCVGIAASMGAILLAGGQKGRRFILPHSTVMIHEPLIADGFGGSATSIDKAAKSILEIKNMVNAILAKHTGKSVEEIDKATLFDNHMTAEQAVKFGLCDEIKTFF